MTDRAHFIVTGGAGFIGSHLVERLLSGGHRVTVIDDLSTGRPENLGGVANHPELRLIPAKVSDCRELPAIVSSANAVYHLAAAVGVELVVTSPVHTIRTNLEETEAVLEAASHNHIPVLLTSTSEVYGKSQKPVFSEDDDLLIGPPNLARWSYACSKLMDEFLAMAYARERGLPVVIARLFNTVGPRQTGRYGMVLPRFITAAKTGQPLKVYGDGKQTRCFCYVADAVEALIRIQNCDAARSQVINVGGTEEVSIETLAKLVIEMTGSRSVIEYVRYADAYAPGFEDMVRRQPLIDKLRRLTGFSPRTSLRDILRLTVEAQ
jgi:UDP-glucose 4-epimerase